MDLGSGVGNVVLQIAGASRVRKAVGIEIASIPAKAALALEMVIGTFRVVVLCIITFTLGIQAVDALVWQEMAQLRPHSG